MEANESSQIIPMNYYLFSITILVDGLRKFIDIPMYSHRMIFPSKITIYSTACEILGIDKEDKTNWNNFAVMNVFKFENKEDYLSYIGELNFQ